MISEISVDELAGLVEGGATLIDVRMPDEYLAAHVPGALLVPLPELPERLGDVPDDATAYVICKMGGRSMKACEFLATQGYEALNVAGGTDAWIESGRPTVSGPEPV
ncbi:MAG: rhodanese-like domain-containing protein [Microthrixaceae bacterium]